MYYNCKIEKNLLDTSNLKKTKLKMFQYQNAFAVLNDTRRGENQKRKYRKHDNNENRKYRKRVQAFPPLSENKVSLPATKMNYKNLIPNLNDWRMKSKTSNSYDCSRSPTNHRQHSSEDEDCEENYNEFNQVWCVEKEGPIIFESDVYSESEDSFIYEEKEYSKF